MILGRSLKAKTPKIPAPVTLDDWNRLMRQAIEAADQAGDRRIHGLRKALADGKVERTLRLMGIIHPGDLRREFPPKD